MFDEVLVVDYITDINALSQDQISQLASKTNESNLLNNCPNGTIIGIPISSYGSVQTKVYYPFFSHIRVPIKAGERAWGFTPDGSGASYWVTRKVQDGAAEDPNFTFEGRSRLAGNLRQTESGRKIISSTFYDPGNTGANISSVVKTAISRSEFIGEPVANVKSKSTDLSLQGSNGAVIKIGDNGVVGSATIDIVTGLASTDSLTTVTNAQSFSGKSYTEVVKPVSGSTGLGAGTLSSEDQSRIIVSRLFNSDSYYSLTGDDSGSQPSITLKTDGVRIVAKNDLKIIVGNSEDPSSIIMKSNGDIIITPSSMGVIKLGGEDAVGAILATADSVVTNGVVTAPSIVDTAGGVLGIPSQPATGVFSTKVLVKVT